MITPKTAAVRYWEIRRIVFIALIVFLGDFSWSMSNSFNSGIDDMPAAKYSDAGVAKSLIAVFLAANAIYSLGYVAEFLLSGWRFWAKPSRTILFLFLSFAGCWFAVRSAQVIADRLSMHKMIWPAMYGIERVPNKSPDRMPGSSASGESGGH